MQPPLISVIIPTYNAEKTIGKTIASVLNQTYPHFEILIINDGSTDATLDVISHIPDPRIKIFSYPNKGLSPSRNRGIQQASGDYIALLDADDLWTPDKLADQLHALEQHPDAAVAYSWTDYIDSQDQLLHQGFYTKANGNVYLKLLLTNFLENGSNPLICKWALAEVGEFDCSLSNASDWEMWLRLAARYPFVCVAKRQVLYRVSSRSVSSNIRGMEACCLRILERHLANASPELQPIKQQSLSNLYLYFTFRTLEISQTRRSSFVSIYYLGQAARYDLRLFQRHTRLTLVALAKICLSIILSPQFAQQQILLIKTRYGKPKQHYQT